MNLNRVEIAGGLTRDPEMKYLPSGIAVCELAVALNGTRYDSGSRQQVVKTTYVTVTCWGWLAEQVAEMILGRGDVVHVLGELDQQEYEKKDGTKERKTRVTAAVVTPVRKRSTQPTPAAGFGAPTGQQPADPWGPPGSPPPGPGWGPPPPDDEPPF